MKRAAKIAVLFVLALGLHAHHARAAECEIISATHSAETKGEAF